MLMFLTNCETENMAESELLCVRVATLPRSKYASILVKSDVIRQYMLSELPRFLFYCCRYLPSLNYCPGKKHRHCSGHNLGEDKLKS